MITKDVREWIKRVENKQYSYEDAMYEFTKISVYLTKEEITMIKNRLKNSYML